MPSSDAPLFVRRFSHRLTSTESYLQKKSTAFRWREWRTEKLVKFWLGHILLDIHNGKLEKTLVFADLTWSRICISIGYYITSIKVFKHLRTILSIRIGGNVSIIKSRSIRTNLGMQCTRQKGWNGERARVKPCTVNWTVKPSDRACCHWSDIILKCMHQMSAAAES